MLQTAVFDKTVLNADSEKKWSLDLTELIELAKGFFDMNWILVF